MRRAQSGSRGVFWRDQAAGAYQHPTTHAAGAWWIRWFCRFGHEHREQVGSMRMAEDAVQKRRGARPCPNHTEKPTRILLADAVREYLDEHAHLRSRREDRRHGAFWIEQLGGRALDEITRADVRKIRADRLKVVSPATCNRTMAFLRHLYNVLIDDGALSVLNPVRGGKRGVFLQEPSGRVRFLTDEEEPRLWSQLAPWEQQRVVVLLDTGLRKSEFLQLRWADVDLKGNVLTVPRSKSGETRHVPLTSRVRAILGGLPRPLDSTALVFPNTVGGPDRRWAEKRVPAVLAQASIANFRFHDFRHTFASRLAMAGVDLKTIQELGGWKSLSMVGRYAHLSKKHLHTSIERLVPGAGVAHESHQESHRG